MHDDEPDWAKELTRKDGHPVLAMAIAVPLLLLSTCGRTDALTGNGTETIAFLLGGVFASVLLFWGIPYLITIRHSSTGWKIGTGLFVAILATLANLWAIGSANAGMQKDFADLTNQADQIMSGERLSMDIGSDAGPLARIGAEVANRNIADVRAFTAELQSSGAEKIAMLQGLSTNSSELQNCERFDALAQKSRQNRGNLATYINDAHARLDAEVNAGNLRQQAVGNFVKGAESNLLRSQRSWELMADYAASVGKLCTILARKHWLVERGQVAFTSEADLAEANQQLARMNRIGAEQEQLQAQARDSLKSKAEAAGL